jgi:hypothetical protein
VAAESAVVPTVPPNAAIVRAGEPSHWREATMREGTDYCWRQAADCAARAGQASDDETRRFFIRLRDSWISVGNRHGLIEWLDDAADIGRSPTAVDPAAAGREAPFKFTRMHG